MEKSPPLKKNRPGLFRVLFGLNEPAQKYTFLAVSIFFVVAFYLSWEYLFPAVIPRIGNIYKELILLVTEKGMPFELGMTLKLVSKAMLYSVLVASFISFAGAITNFFKPISVVFPNFRFWSTLGFASVMRMTIGVGGAFQIALLMFGIIPFLVTAFNGVLRKIDEDPLYDYARTMGYPEWKCIYYVVIRSKLVKFYLEIRNTFAIAWVMVPYAEIANRDSGGIGAMVFDNARFVTGDDPFAAAFALNFVILICGIFFDFLVKLLILTLAEERINKKTLWQKVKIILSRTWSSSVSKK